MIIEDFFNGDSAFDMLVDHAPTMDYIRAIVPERPTINNSEIRIRYPGNQTRRRIWAGRCFQSTAIPTPGRASAA